MPFPEEDVVPDFCSKPVLILGVGNIFFGDDGFGCALVEYLQTHCDLPDGVCLQDAGTGVRKLLFTLCLSHIRPRRLLIVDAVDCRRDPGEWFELDPADIPVVKLDDFSMHQLPTSNMLRELQQQTGVEVRVLACQTGPLPAEVCPGLSEPVRRAVPEASRWVEREYLQLERGRPAGEPWPLSALPVAL